MAFVVDNSVVCGWFIGNQATDYGNKWGQTRYCHDIGFLSTPKPPSIPIQSRPRRQCARVGLNETWLLQPKLAMRTKADELQYSVIWFAVNQQQIRLDVAVPMVFPVAA